MLQFHDQTLTQTAMWIGATSGTPVEQVECLQGVNLSA